MTTKAQAIKQHIQQTLEEAGCSRYDNAKYYSNYIDFGDVEILLDKRFIETEFYFVEHNYEDRSEEVRAASSNESFFLKKNLEYYDFILSLVDGRYTTKVIPFLIYKKYDGQLETSKLGRITWINPSCDNTDDDYSKRRMTAEELTVYRRAIVEERERFVKRLRTYLKRYGLSKCLFTTFCWDDR